MSRHEDRQCEADLLQGTLDLLILQILALEPLHGYGLVQRLEQVTRGALQVRQGSLYPALYRLEKRGLLKARWKTVAGRDAKFYTLTKAGGLQLETEKTGWERLTSAVALVLDITK
jgi:PadR family transcriptional regulator PadR